jgi:hypothetical protein
LVIERLCAFASGTGDFLRGSITDLRPKTTMTGALSNGNKTLTATIGKGLSWDAGSFTLNLRGIGADFAGRLVAYTSLTADDLGQDGANLNIGTNTPVTITIN